MIPTLPTPTTDRHTGRSLPVMIWHCGATPWRSISSGPLGGGLGTARWVLNATVEADYTRDDPGAHLREIALAHGLVPDVGVGVMTAVDVTRTVSFVDADRGATLWASVGIGFPQWAAKSYLDEAPEAVRDLDEIYTPHTINVVAVVPVALSDAALVNAIATVAEAKAQAFVDLGIAGTGTITDTTTILCPLPVAGAPVEPYGGPRSVWGSWLANATHRCVLDGALADERLVGRVDVPGPITRSGVTR